MRSNSARRFLLAIVAVVLLSMAATAVAAETVSLTARRDFPVDSASINVVKTLALLRSVSSARTLSATAWNIGRSANRTVIKMLGERTNPAGDR